MKTQQKRMVQDLHVGMYVSELDRPWLETPFKLQGFLIRNQEQINELNQWCNYVHIDIEKGKEALVRDPLKTHSRSNISKAKAVPPAIYSFTRYNKRANTYQQNHGFYKASSVEKVQLQINQSLAQVDAALAQGKVFDPKPLELAAKDLVKSVLENPDVLAWLGRVEHYDQHSHEHAIRTAVWSCLFARHLGLAQTDILILVQAALLKDIGQTRLPKHIMSQAETALSAADQKLYRKYVSLSVALLKQIKGLNPKVRKVIEAHREHYNGAGFPHGLQGDEIPLLSIMLGIARRYDDMLHPREQAKALAPSDVMRQLHKLKNTEFQEDLVSEFFHSQGLFPAGSIVELNTGALAIVVEQSKQNKMRPVVAIVTDAERRALKKITTINLATEADAEPSIGKRPHLTIVRDLALSECELDIIAIKAAIFKPSRSALSFFKR
ncbi:MAG: DUF3391 domain-containing protein [Pseudomonadales bacterium]|nr:DUF3391 domain-containing protein [Pseudomonadales bacterium]